VSVDLSATSITNTPGTAAPTGLYPSPSAGRARRRQLPAGAAFSLQVSILVFFLAGSSAPTPLYALYRPSGDSRR